MNEFLLIIITALLAAIGYFIKQILDGSAEHSKGINDLQKDIADIKPKIDLLWQDKLAIKNSPRQLNEFGQRILAESGIKDLVDQHKDELLQMVKEKKDTNPYDAEETVIEVMNSWELLFPETLESLKTRMFNAGADMQSTLYAGAIYLRNLIFPDLGFIIDDLELPKK